MKLRHIMTLCLLCAVLPLGCAKQEMDNAEPDSSGEEQTGVVYTYDFAIDAEDTRTVFGEDHIVWETGDLVGYYYKHSGTQSGNRSAAVWKDSDGKAYVTICSDIALVKGDMVYAYYPYSKGNDDKNASGVAFELVRDQNLGDGDSMPMVALPYTIGDTSSKENECSLNFVSLGSVIKFNVYSSSTDYQGEVIENVSFVANTPITGTFNYDITNVDDSTPASIGGYTGTDVVVTGRGTVGAAKESGTEFYIAVAPGTVSGQFVIRTDKADYTYSFADAKVFSRGALKPFNINLAGASWDRLTGYDHSIDSPREFSEFLYGTSESDTGTYTITADLDMTGYTALNASGFGGTLDGGNHRVYNITAGKALFASNKGTIKNLTLEGSFSSSTEYFLASLVKEDAGGVYDKVINKASVTFTANANISSGMAIGGLVAAAKGADFDKCYNYGDVVINAEGYYHSALGMGGFAGYSLGHTTIDECHNYGTVKVLAKAAKTRTDIVIWGTTYTNNNVAVAGFVGRDLTTFASADDCTEAKLEANALAINQCENKKGADVVVSYSDITILGDSNEGYASVAGIAGMGNVYIYKCLNYADVKTSALGGAVSIKELIMRVGGILGRPYDYCYVGSSKMEGNLTYVNDNTCDISNSKAAVGGIVGNGGYNGSHGKSATGLVEIYYNTMNGDIAASGKGKNYSVGGIVGHGGKQIANKVNASCKITLKDESNSGWKFVGGLVGTLFGDAQYTTVKSSICAATIEVTSTNNKIAAGGLLGFWGQANTGDFPCLTARDGTPCQFTGSITCNQPYVGVAIGKVDGSSSKTCKFGDSDNPIKASGTINGTTINTANVENLAIGENLCTTTIYITVK